ncbi:MAG: hypothetical protein BWX80_01667 [Candidatus Hydrogenedentes bacterium ADurb.Bin101]|jgi:plasmid stabilization system protein ParE|nr:MAG: hypothetical protein BWX80_01667 [Candidatus Hydrogenedentes bacterium ADurb.Bin101]HOC70504.1 type II toxin-antitoxin system RelE/ParE family toxin [Candidatus Hydrogenedentota bacterium]
MNATLVLLPEAKKDVEHAYRWYEEQSLGLGMEFLRCLEVILTSIQHTPTIYPTVQGTCRRAILRRFPYAVFFEIEQERNSCTVYSVFHCAQDPDKWQERLT